MSTNFSQPNAPLRQVLVNTHSPLLIQNLQSEVVGSRNDKNVRLYLARLNHQVSKTGKLKTTRITPVEFNKDNLLPFKIDEISDVERKITAQQLQVYLETAKLQATPI